jgi:hypothetical protein
MIIRYGFGISERIYCMNEKQKNKIIKKWRSKSEDEKLHWCLDYAISAMQGFLFNEPHSKLAPEYCDFLKHAIDWASVRAGNDPLPLYYGEGRNSAESFHKQPPCKMDYILGKHALELVFNSNGDGVYRCKYCGYEEKI